MNEQTVLFDLLKEGVSPVSYTHLDYQAKQDGFIQPYADSPLDDEHVGESVYMNLIAHAKKEIYFTTPYLIITDEMNRALGLAAKRGVDVRIVTPGIPVSYTHLRAGIFT